jgi:hypothetical protein
MYGAGTDALQEYYVRVPTRSTHGAEPSGSCPDGSNARAARVTAHMYVCTGVNGHVYIM